MFPVEPSKLCALAMSQVECEHQLGLERERTAAALKQRDAAESRTGALEAQFTEYVASQRNAPEAQLKAELAEAQRASKAAETKLQAALKLKQKYKQQVGWRIAALWSWSGSSQQQARHNPQSGNPWPPAVVTNWSICHEHTASGAVRCAARQ